MDDGAANILTPTERRNRSIQRQLNRQAMETVNHVRESPSIAMIMNAILLSPIEPDHPGETIKDIFERLFHANKT